MMTSTKYVQKYLPPFLMLSGGVYAVAKESLAGVIVFTVSSLLMGFLAFLERKQLDDLEALQADINILKARLDGLALGRSMGL